MSIKGQGNFLTIYFLVLYVLCFTWPRYQVSVYRTIGPLVFQYLENETKFCIHIIIDKIYVGIVNPHFSQICNKVMALDCRQNSVFVQYLENEWREFYQILFIRSTLGL